MTMRLGPILAALMLALSACGGMSTESKDATPSTSPTSTKSFSILAGSELKDVETGLKADIRSNTGLDLVFTYSGTLEAADRIAANEPFDALWVSHGKYISMNDA